MKDQIKIRHIATSLDGKRIAFGEFEKTVHIYDLDLKKIMLTLDTTLDFGGDRLAISSDGSKLATAAWTRSGVCLYDINSKGNLLWQRKDLKNPQIIKFNLKGDKLFVFLNNQSAQVINVKTGKTVLKLPGVYEIFESKFNKIKILERTTKRKTFPTIPYSLFLEGELSHKKISLEDDFSIILDVEFLPEACAVAEAGGNLSVYSIKDGKKIWSYTPENGSHFLNIGYNPKYDRLYAVSWFYVRGGYIELLEFDCKTGEMLNARLLGFKDNAPTGHEFLLNSELLVTSDGDIFDLKYFKIKYKIDFFKREVVKNEK